MERLTYKNNVCLVSRRLEVCNDGCVCVCHAHQSPDSKVKLTLSRVCIHGEKRRMRVHVSTHEAWSGEVALGVKVSGPYMQAISDVECAQYGESTWKDIDGLSCEE